jgi:hypothetical protein
MLNRFLVGFFSVIPPRDLDLIVGQTTCFGISQAPGNVRVARGQKECLSQGL